jgi:hypothetical protein
MEESMKEAFVNAMVTALEGGSEYWCEEVSYLSATRKQMSLEDWFESGKSLRVVFTEDEEIFLVSHDSFFARVNKLFPDWAEFFSDEGDYDAADADQFFQFGMFGEVVYG